VNALETNDGHRMVQVASHLVKKETTPRLGSSGPLAPNVVTSCLKPPLFHGDQLCVGIASSCFGVLQNGDLSYPLFFDPTNFKALRSASSQPFVTGF
jgi:hypothetical protein